MKSTVRFILNPVANWVVMLQNVTQDLQVTNVNTALSRLNTVTNWVVISQNVTLECHLG